MSEPRYQVDVSVVTRYLPEQSQPEHDRFAFAYTITVKNNGSIPAKLLSRHWIITDGDGRVEEVRGPGVVGYQPVIAPGEQFQYVSGCPLDTPVGTMHGSFQMVSIQGDAFEASIAPFRLMVPNILQ